MVQVSGNTYRIVCTKRGTYDAVRVLDDVRIGSFGDGPPLRLDSPLSSQPLLRQIAHTAIRSAKTSWLRTTLF
jgi:hypothetical protein